MNIPFPFCDAHNKPYGRWSSILTVVGMALVALGLLLGCGGILLFFLEENRSGSTASVEKLASLIGSIIVVAGVTVFIVSMVGFDAPPITTAGMTRSTIILSGVAPEFVEALRQAREHRDAQPARADRQNEDRPDDDSPTTPYAAHAAPAARRRP